jgi:hypothetical protein
MADLQCDAALSDLVLQAARAAIPADWERWWRAAMPSNGIRNKPLIPLLTSLLDATQTVAAAVADNAWDESHPIDKQLARDLAKQALNISDDLINATQCPDARDWSLPSMTGKELV